MKRSKILSDNGTQIPSESFFTIENSGSEIRSTAKGKAAQANRANTKEKRLGLLHAGQDYKASALAAKGGLRRLLKLGYIASINPSWPVEET